MGLRFSILPLVLDVLRRFKIRFHQMNPSCFPKLSVYVWACRSQGAEEDMDLFIPIAFIHSITKCKLRGSLLFISLGFTHILLSSWGGASLAGLEEQVGYAVAGALVLPQVGQWFWRGSRSLRRLAEAWQRFCRSGFNRQLFGYY